MIGLAMGMPLAIRFGAAIRVRGPTARSRSRSTFVRRVRAGCATRSATRGCWGHPIEQVEPTEMQRRYTAMMAG
jgi:hypothetical protein